MLRKSAVVAVFLAILFLALPCLAQEKVKLRVSSATKSWEFYTGNRIWHPDGDINVEGLKTTIQIFQEVTGGKGAPPSPVKYIDQSYLKEALKELKG